MSATYDERTAELTDEIVAAAMAAARHRAIHVAALLLGDGDDELDSMGDSDFVRGQCELIADTFGAEVEDHDEASRAVWGEIAAELRRINSASNRTYFFRGFTRSGPSLVRHLLSIGELSPAASAMPAEDAFRMFNEANALEIGDVDFIHRPGKDGL